MSASPKDHPEPYNDPDIRPIVASIFKKLPFRLDELANALSKQDWETVNMLSHRLKGTLGGCGFRDLSAIAGAMEDEAHTHRSLDKFTDLFEQLKESIERTRVERDL